MDVRPFDVPKCYPVPIFINAANNQYSLVVTYLAIQNTKKGRNSTTTYSEKATLFKVTAPRPKEAYNSVVPLTASSF